MSQTLVVDGEAHLPPLPSVHNVDSISMQSGALANTSFVDGLDGSILPNTALPEYWLLGLEARAWYGTARRRRTGPFPQISYDSLNDLDVSNGTWATSAGSSSLNPSSDIVAPSIPVSWDGSISQTTLNPSFPISPAGNLQDITSILSEPQHVIPRSSVFSRPPSPSPPPRPSCTICGDSIEGSIVHPRCGHELDVSCLETMFDKATRDESLFPPKCCQIPIELDDVRQHLNAPLVHRFLRKSREFQTKDRVYCHDPSCSAFLGAKTAAPRALRCPGCGTETCGSCKEAAHAKSACSDRLADSVLALAKELGWQRCPSCKHLVERTQGCNHMSCVCGKQFCYMCGMTWKMCGCRQYADLPVNGNAGRGRRAPIRRTRNQAGREQRPPRGGRAQRPAQDGILQEIPQAGRPPVPPGPPQRPFQAARTLMLGPAQGTVIESQLGTAAWLPDASRLPAQVGRSSVEVGRLLVPVHRLGEPVTQESIPTLPWLFVRPPHVPR